MVRLIANLIGKSHQHSSSGVYKTLSLARLEIRKLSPAAAMSSDGIPRTRENSITKTSTHRVPHICIYVYDALYKCYGKGAPVR